MPDTDKIKAEKRGLFLPWGVFLAAFLVLLIPMIGGGVTSVKALEKLDVQIERTDELKTEIKELRTELTQDNAHLRAEINDLRERVAKLEAKVGG